MSSSDTTSPEIKTWADASVNPVHQEGTLGKDAETNRTGSNASRVEHSADLEDNQLKLQKRFFTPLLLKKVPPVPEEADRLTFPIIPRWTHPIEWFFFTWLIPVLRAGYKRTLQPPDLLKLNDTIKVDPLAEKFKECFERRSVKYRQKHIAEKILLRGETPETNSVLEKDDLMDFEPGPTLAALATFDTFTAEYISALSFMAAALAIQTTQPLLSKKLINYVALKAFGAPLSDGQGVGYAIGSAVMIFASSMAFNHAFFLSTFIGARMRGVLTKVILDKSFRLSARSSRKYPPLKITSLMSTDVSRIDLGIGFSLWTAAFPIPIGIAIGILVYNIHAPALVGVGIMFAYLIFAGGFGLLLFVYRKEALKQTDARVGLIKEILANLKIIKLYAWELPYLDMITKIRNKEMRFLLKMEVVRSIIISVASSLTLISSYAAFLVLYAISSPTRRNPAAIFSSVSLFAILSNAFIVLPLSLASVIDAVISFGRVGNYLSTPEDAELFVFGGGVASSSSELDNEAKHAVSFSNASFEWEIFEDDSEDEDEEKKTDEEKKAIKKRRKEKARARKKAIKEQKRRLRQIKNGALPASQPLEVFTQKKEHKEDKQTFAMGPLNFDIHHGELLVITGQIGCGKSSLLHAINGTMKNTGGSVDVAGKLIMVGSPWIQNATVRDNILFGLPYDEEWYHKVVFSTCLESDIDMLPAGDLTEVGERGITMSGGQKARLCLARAVYADPSIILLDDVLSAVDAKVGKHIMDHCISGLLKDKTRVLATHQLSLISSADRVLFLGMDRSVTLGQLDDLKGSSAAFKALMDLNTTSEENKGDNLGEEKPDFPHLDTKRKVFTKEDGILMTEEQKSVNAISFGVVSKYISTGARGFKFNWIIYVCVLFYIFYTFFELFTNTWLSFWISDKFKSKSNGWYIGLYTLFTVLAVFFNITSFALVVYVMNRASRILNIEACRRIFYVPMAYMDVTPMGRIINRFTKDTDVLDNEMGDKIAMVAFFSFFVAGIFILVIIYLPWFAIAVPFIIFVFLLIASIYQASGREIKRLEAIQRSKVYNNFNETLTGMETIKNYHKNDDFLTKNSILINQMNEAYFITVANQRWLEISVTGLSTGFVLLISFLCVFRVFKISAASVGLVLSYILLTTGLISFLVVIFTQVEQDMNSAERVIEYLYDLPQEAPYMIAETKPADSWPEHGQIEFRNVSMSYRPGLPLVLKDFTASIKPNEKIGICGRTGAGKSSITVALYRIAEILTGSIHIDGIDISKLGLNELRSRLSIIPQDSVLFDGTIRKNLDPFGEKTDEQLWNVLRRTNIIDSDLFETVKLQLPSDPELHRFHLDRVVEREGANFSLGERQLVSFARALVRDTKILVLDEATSSVDYATDKKIQDAIVSEFSYCTILCIAHRLKTILKYDRIIVMEKGEVVEFDTPVNLFNLSGGYFRQMCDKTGIIAGDFEA